MNTNLCMHANSMPPPVFQGFGFDTSRRFFHNTFNRNSCNTLTSICVKERLRGVVLRFE
jgi:hypothetical protein